MKLSIITATYNSALTLQRCLNSVSGQTAVKSIEHLIIDNASTDETLEIVSEYPHISYCESEQDRGIYHAFNKGVAASTGDLLYFLNSDDYLYAATTAEEVIEQFKSDTDFLSGRVLVVNPDTGQIHISPSKAETADSYRPAHQGFICHRRVFEKIGPFNECFSIAADTYLMKRAIAECSGVISDQVIAAFNQNGVSSKPENRELLIKQHYLIDCLLNKEIDRNTLEARLASQINVANRLKTLILSAFQNAARPALNRFKDMRIGVFGYRQVSQILVQLLERNNIPVICYIASDATLHQKIDHHPVVDLANAKKLKLDVIIVGVEGEHKLSIINGIRRELPDVSVFDWTELSL